MNYEQAILDFAPGYMRGGNIGLLLRSFGAGIDQLAERSFLGRCAALPHAAGARRERDGMLLQCEPDVLPYHARDRQITLYSTEPEASKRLRCAKFRQLHARRGTHRGEMEYVQPLFLGADGLGVLPRMRIVHQSGDDGNGPVTTWHTLSGSYDSGGAGVYSTFLADDPNNWNFDGQTDRWSRWWCIIYTHGTALESGLTVWDGGEDWDGGQYWDGFDGRVTDDLHAGLIEWKSAHSRCAGLILTRDLSSFDPTLSATTHPDGWTSLPIGNWANGIDPITGKPTRPPYATFLFMNP